MKQLKYKNEHQFINEFSSELNNELKNKYNLEINKRINSKYSKYLDIYLKNRKTGKSFIIEVKGSPNKGSLPPEIIPSLKKLQSMGENEEDQIILISLSKVNDKVKDMFDDFKIKLFEYENHKDNFTKDFICFLDNMEDK